MGPSVDCVLRRSRLPAVDLEKEALKQPKLTKKKVRHRIWLLMFIHCCGSACNLSQLAARFAKRKMMRRSLGALIYMVELPARAIWDWTLLHLRTGLLQCRETAVCWAMSLSLS
jgi:hypothetical protein